jgi:hypothetical protein
MCWGDNSDGQLGDTTFDQKMVPTAPTGLPPAALVAAGRTHTCAATSNAVWCWGQDDAGQLGDGSATTADRPTPEASMFSCP